MKKTTYLKSACAATTLLIGLVSAPPGLAATVRVPADYSTIQAAADAASSGDTVEIAAGVYAEQILIVGKSLTLAGKPGAVVRAFVGMAQTLLPYDGENRAALLGIVSSEAAVVTGLAFEGEHLADAGSDSLVGIYFRGSSGRVENCTVEGFHGSNQLTSINGWGIKVANYSAGPPLINVQVLNCIFADDLRAIGISGDEKAPTVLRTAFTLQDNTITGIGPTESGYQLGIIIGSGASGEVRHNRITDHYHTTSGLLLSLGVFASDFVDVIDRSLVPIQPVRYVNNTFVSNQVALASFKSSTSQVVGNSFQGSGQGSRFDIGIAVSGDEVNVATNDFSNMTRGVVLFGNDPDFGTMYGTATNPQLAGNRFCEVTTSIDTEPLVTGVSQQGTQVCPFPPPTLAIGAAVILSWPIDAEGWILEAASAPSGPWTPTSEVPTQQGGQNVVAVYTDANHRFFRLQHP